METNESTKKPSMSETARILNAVLGCGRVRAEETAESLSDAEKAELAKRYEAKDGPREWLSGLLDARADAKRAAKQAETTKPVEPQPKPVKKTEPTPKPSADVVPDAGA